MNITSTRNPLVKRIVRLRKERKEREQEGLMVVEGQDEIRLALSAGFRPQTLLLAPDLAETVPADLVPEPLTVSRAAFEKMSYRDHPDGWLALFPIPKVSLGEIRLGRLPLVIVAEAVEKPGNLGAILRTADAAAADALLLCEPGVDAWNPNVVRASRGALFSVPVIETDSVSALDWLRRNGIRILAAAPQADSLYTSVDMRQPLAIVVGAEDRGLSDFWMQHADVRVKIPMWGKVNSLNVSIAAALLMYEAVRQRTGQ